MATLKCKGLTGVVFDITVTMGSTTMNGLTALAQAIEGQEITTSEYEDVAATKNLSINQTNNGSDTLTAACLVDGDMVQCIPLGRTTSRTKRQRQEQKLKIAVTKRKGLAAGNTNANYYRALNTKSKANLPTLYKAGDNVTANRVDICFHSLHTVLEYV